MYDHDSIIQANIALHSAAADRYHEQPHYLPESRSRVRNIMAALHSRTGGKAMLDLCCGMGFMIDIGCEFFSIIRGVDITPAMLKRIDCNRPGCDIQVMECAVESLPFEDSTFDICTAFAALHHLHDIDTVLAEALRVLKPGGIFYADLDPNASFWNEVKKLDPKDQHPEFVYREMVSTSSKEQEIASTFNVDVSTVQLAEHWMHLDGGFHANELEASFRKAGFAQAEVTRHWFLGEAGFINNEKHSENAIVLREYLQSLGPLTNHLFKYLTVVATKM